MFHSWLAIGKPVLTRDNKFMDPQESAHVYLECLDRAIERHDYAVTMKMDEDTETFDLEVGSLVYVLRDQGVSDVDLSDRTKLSPSHLSRLEEKAMDALITNPKWGNFVPILDSKNARSFVLLHGGVKNIYASFSWEGDTFWFANMRPDQIDWDRGHGFPHMILRTRNGPLVGVTDVNVGYGGAGCGYAAALLRELAIPDELAKAVYRSRVSNVDVDHPDKALHTFRWPYVTYPIPRPYEGKYVVGFEAKSLDEDGEILSEEEADRVSDYGFYPTPSGRSPLCMWIDLLDSPHAPEWLQGPRTVTVYTSSEACYEKGMVVDSYTFAGPNGVYPIKIQQGQVETWISYDPDSEGFAAVDFLNSTARKVLEAVGVDENVVKHIDASHRALRYINQKILNRPRPISYTFTKEWVITTELPDLQADN